MAPDTTFPADLPVPVDDGACAHLAGSAIASVQLPATSGSSVDLSQLSGLTIAFCYPRTAAPDETVPDSWNQIPGARGCTPQACSFRDSADDLLAAGVSHVFGISTQDTSYQQEVKGRLHLPYHLLSDEKLAFTDAMKLPTFKWEGSPVIKRLTLAIVDGKIAKIWYPVFPPDRSADEVLGWLQKDWQGRATLSTDTENQMIRNFQHRG